MHYMMPELQLHLQTCVHLSLRSKRSTMLHNQFHASSYSGPHSWQSVNSSLPVSFLSSYAYILKVHLYFQVLVYATTGVVDEQMHLMCAGLMHRLWQE